MLFLEPSNRVYSIGIDKIRFESENYFFYLNNLRIKENCKNQMTIIEMVKDLESFFEFKVAEVLSIDESGKATCFYKIKDNVVLPPDKDFMEVKSIKFKYGSGLNNYENILGEYGLEIKNKYKNLSLVERDEIYPKIKRELQETLKNILDKYVIYSPPKMNCSIDFGNSNIPCNRFRKKRNVGKQWNLSHQDSYDSEIEKILGEALKKRDINFIQQQKIYYQGALFTILDFYIKESNLAIYCDGFKYHYDKDTVIKDRQQDRILQLLGYRVLRFTGSEIVGNINNCINEILLFIDRFKNI